MMSLNTVKYKGELLAEDNALVSKSPGVLGEYKELRADALEADTLDITVLSESGTIRSFKKNDKVEYFRSGSRVGVYYLQSVTRVGPKLYTLSALSAVGLLIVRPHRGGIYTGQTVAEVVAEICGDIPVLIETVYRGIKLYGWLPIASARDSLVQVLFAIGAWLHTDENGTLRVQKLWNGTASIIGPGSVHAANIQVKYLDPVSAVSVTEHQYIAGTEDVTLFEGTAQQGDVIEFDEPAHTLTAEGFAILESGANYAVLSAGTGKLTGKSYVHNRRVVTRTVTEGAAENVEEITDATLVSLVNSSAVAQRMAAYYACREQLTVDVNPAGEHAGHVVSLWNEWDKQQTLACIASRETKISGLLKSRTSALVGFLPPQPESSEYYDERVVLTGSGTWTVPDDVTTLRAVLVDQGADGTDGADGAAGASTSLIMTTAESQVQSFTRQVNGGKGGAGGEAGLGGLGGRILSADLDVTPGASFAYSVAEEATFGDLSSANGSRSDAGFTDPITGDVYGKKGDDGLAGGAGGDGGNFTNMQGSDGAAVGDAPGGAGQKGYSTGRLPITSGGTIGYVTRAISGNAGGGAARDTQGGAFSSGSNFLTNSRGGNGANAPDAEPAPSYGCGGNGGSGGGGGGGATGFYISVSMNSGYTYSFDVWYTASGGSKGAGSKGSSGKPGCIILYYRRPKPLSAGWLRDNTQKPLLDRLGRRLIV
nr:MAG TPA: hypothetical protein [Caudoviricetes sp.]